MALSILDLAAWVGHHQLIEARLATLVGGWACDDREPAAASLFAAHCPQFAWHAELWAERLPSQPSTSLDAARAAHPPVLGEPSRFDESIIHSVDTLAVATDTIERLVGIYQLVLPRLLATFESLRSTVDPRVDGPTARALDLVTRDVTMALAEGTDLLNRLRG